MTTEELLIQRYEVIAPAPCMLNEIGEILEPIKAPHPIKELIGKYVIRFGGERGDFFTYPALEDMDAFPHIFKKLGWYERRKLEDLPMYVKYAKTGNVYRVCPELGWYAGSGCVYTLNRDGSRHSVSCDIKKYNMLPSTEQEYKKFRGE